MTMLIVILGLCVVYIIVYFCTPSFVSGGIGYEVGNRLRIIAVTNLEIKMIPLSLFAYQRMVSFFLSSNEGQTYKDYTSSRTSLSATKLLRTAIPLLVLLWLILSHMAHVLFYIPEGVRISLSYISNVSLGFWTYFVPILFGFALCSVLVYLFSALSITRPVVHYVLRNRFLNLFLTDEQFQVKITLILSVVISLLTHISSRQLFVKEITFHLKDLPKEAEDLRFALLSDLHAGACVHRELIAKVVDTVNSENVDGVFIVGDAVDGRRDDIFNRLGPLQHLNSKHGTFYVSGNHDYYYGNASEWFKQLGDYGVTVLNNRNVNVSGICLAGVNDYSSGRSGIEGHKFDPVKALEGCDSKGPVIVLSHNPASASEVVSNKNGVRVDLILSGHTHAGQFYTMAPLVYWALPYFHGLYEVAGKTKLFVSAGTLYQGPPMKMLGFSEIWIVTLKSL